MPPMKGGPAGDEASVLPASHLRFPLFDSLRALAAIAILLVHTAIFSGAASSDIYGRFLRHLDIGVPFFFLLSAFVLYRPFLAARVQGGERTSFGSYAIRRFTRIAPAYWLALTVAAIVPGVAGAFSGNWWVYYGLLQNYPIDTLDPGCAATPFRCGLPQTWSLAVEIMFYATLPLFVLAMGAIARRRNSRSNWLPAELWAVVVLSAISVVIQSLPLTRDALVWLFYSPLGRGWWFGLGLALAALSVWADQQRREPRFVRIVRTSPGPFVLLAVALYALSCIVLDDSLVIFPLTGRVEYIAQYLLFGVIALLVLLPAALGSDGAGRFRRFLRHRTLAWLGLVSYGIFLWHYPVMLALVDVGILDLWRPLDFPLLALATFALTIACAAASYYGLERPLMRLVRNRRGRAGPSRRSIGAAKGATPG